MRSLEEEARVLHSTLMDIVMREDFEAFKTMMITNRMAQLISNTVDEVTGQPVFPTDDALRRRMTTLKRLFVIRMQVN